MIELMLFLLSTIGLTHIIVDSVIAEKPVNWLKKKLPDKVLWFNPKEALDCHQCTGFWIGIFCAAMWGIPWGPAIAFNTVSSILASFFIIAFITIKLFLCGCAGSLASLWAAHYFTYLQVRSIIDIDEE